MGEQIHTQIETLPIPDSQSSYPKPQSSPDTIPLILPPPPPHFTAAPEPSHPVPPTEIPTKIPIRPPKIRKLSTPFTDEKLSPPETTGDDSFAAPVTTIGTTTTQVHYNSAPKNRRRSSSQVSKALRVIKPLSADGEIEFAIRHLRVADPLLIPLIDSNPLPHFESHHLPFLALTKSILYQQLAYKAGTSIYSRFVSLCGGEDSVRPDTVLGLTSQQLKHIGVSGRKASYLYDLANKYKSGILSDNTIVKMDDRSLFTMLSMVKGIGSWSVHMFMIFSLHRPDVLPVSDLGVRKGVRLLYGLEDLPRPSQMEQLCEKWRPYRSVGAWYMWRFVEGKEGPTAGAGVTMDGRLVQPLQQIEPQHDGHQQHQLHFVEPVGGIVNLG